MGDHADHFGTVTSWLPLTTTFPYSSGCSSAIWARWGFTETIGYNAVAFDPGYGITVDPAVICMPSQVTLWWETETAPTVDGVATRYSIGPVVCPQAYTMAVTSVVNEESTQVACCPSSGYKFQQLQSAGLIGECASSVSKGGVVTYVMEKSPGVITGGLTTTSTTLANDYYVLGVPVNGYNFAASITSSSSSPSSSSSSTTTASSATSSILPTGSSVVRSGGHHGLPPGAIAGIAVSLSLVAIVVVVAGLFLFVPWLKKSREQQERPGDYNWDGSKQEQPIVHELHDMDRPHEIGSPKPRPHELSG